MPADGPLLPLVLIVEDDRDTRQFYAQFLVRAGFRIAQAHNGLQAIEKAADLLPDAIVVDLALPGIDGFELARRLKDDSRTRHIPLIAVTGRFMDSFDLERARKQGCRTVLTKPFPLEELTAELRATLDEPGAADKDMGDT